MWVGTHNGLSRLEADEQTFKTFTTRDGLPNDVIYGVRSDREGRLWLSTNNGLSRFDPETGDATNYGVTHGLQAAEFNFGAWHQSTSGELFFGGINGFNASSPSASASSVSPAGRGTSATVDHRAVSGPPDHLRASRWPSAQVCSASSSPPSTSPHRRDQFAYKLEGFDTDWCQWAPSAA